MELVKLKDKTNGAVIEVKKSLAADYIGTGRYEIVEKVERYIYLQESTMLLTVVIYLLFGKI